MKKIVSSGKKKIVVKIVAGVVTVAIVGTGIGYGAVYAKNNKLSDDVEEKTVVSEAVENKAEAEDDTDEQADLLTNIIKSQVGEESSDTGKEENVYVISDANGAPTKVIVSDWLKNPDAKDSLTDASDLTDITNVKGDETFKQDKSGSLNWAANGKDIYYQGSTDKELPVSVKVTYYLNNKETEPKDMVGKSGKVKIRFDYENKQTQIVEINGKEENVYVPFTVMSAMMLPTNTFTDITVTNGKVMSEGLNNIVMGLAFPGLKDSLQLDEKKLEEKDIDIPDYVEVNAITSDFSLDMTLSVVLSDALSDIHLTDSIDLSEVDDNMDKLTDASSELENGTKKLKDGVDTLNDKTSDFQSGAKKLSDGITTYTNGVASLSDGITTLKDGTQKAADGASSLASGALQVSDGVNTLVSSLGNMGASLAGSKQTQETNKAGLEQLVEVDHAAVTSEVTAYTGAVAQAVAAKTAELLSAGQDLSSQESQAALMGAVASVSSEGLSGAVETLAVDSGNLGGATGALQVIDTISSQLDTSKLNQLQSGASSVASGASDLSSGINQLNSGADQLKSGVETLTSNSAALVSGASTLYDGTTQLADGVSKLQTGANDLNTGMIKFDKEGITKLTDAFEGEGKTVLDRLNATMDAGHDYHTFTKLPEGMEGSVKFIIRTDAVK